MPPELHRDSVRCTRCCYRRWSRGVQKAEGEVKRSRANGAEWSTEQRSESREQTKAGAEERSFEGSLNLMPYNVARRGHAVGLMSHTAPRPRERVAKKKPQACMQLCQRTREEEYTLPYMCVPCMHACKSECAMGGTVRGPGRLTLGGTTLSHLARTKLRIRPLSVDAVDRKEKGRSSGCQDNAINNAFFARHHLDGLAVGRGDCCTS